MVRAASAPIPPYAGAGRPIKELGHSIIIRRKTGKSPDHRWMSMQMVGVGGCANESMSCSPFICFVQASQPRAR